MKMTKRIMAIVFALAMTVCFFVGCTKPEETATPAPATATPEPATPTPEPAPLYTWDTYVDGEGRVCPYIVLAEGADRADIVDVVLPEVVNGNTLTYIPFDFFGMPLYGGKPGLAGEDGKLNDLNLATLQLPATIEAIGLDGNPFIWDASNIEIEFLGDPQKINWGTVKDWAIEKGYYEEEVIPYYWDTYVDGAGRVCPYIVVTEGCDRTDVVDMILPETVNGETITYIPYDFLGMELYAGKKGLCGDDGKLNGLNIQTLQLPATIESIGADGNPFIWDAGNIEIEFLGNPNEIVWGAAKDWAIDKGWLEYYFDTYVDGAGRVCPYIVVTDNGDRTEITDLILPEVLNGNTITYIPFDFLGMPLYGGVQGLAGEDNKLNGLNLQTVTFPATIEAVGLDGNPFIWDAGNIEIIFLGDSQSINWGAAKDWAIDKGYYEELPYYWDTYVDGAGRVCPYIVVAEGHDRTEVVDMILPETVNGETITYIPFDFLGMPLYGGKKGLAGDDNKLNDLNIQTLVLPATIESIGADGNPFIWDAGNIEIEFLGNPNDIVWGGAKDWAIDKGWLEYYFDTYVDGADRVCPYIVVTDNGDRTEITDLVLPEVLNGKTITYIPFDFLGMPLYGGKKGLAGDDNKLNDLNLQTVTFPATIESVGADGNPFIWDAGNIEINFLSDPQFINWGAAKDWAIDKGYYEELPYYWDTYVDGAGRVCPYIVVAEGFDRTDVVDMVLPKKVNGNVITYIPFDFLGMPLYGGVKGLAGEDNKLNDLNVATLVLPETIKAIGLDGNPFIWDAGNIEIEFWGDPQNINWGGAKGWAVDKGYYDDEIPYRWETYVDGEGRLCPYIVVADGHDRTEVVDVELPEMIFGETITYIPFDFFGMPLYGGVKGLAGDDNKLNDLNLATLTIPASIKAIGLDGNPFIWDAGNIEMEFADGFDPASINWGAVRDWAIDKGYIDED